MAEAMELSAFPTRRSQSTIDRALGPDHDSQIEPVTQYALPPVDGGRRAWTFLAAATFIEILIWGLPFSVGILRVLEQHFVRRVWCVDVDFGSYSSDGFIVYELCIFRTVSEAIHKLGCCL